MSRTLGSGGVEHLEAQAARLRNLACELRADLEAQRETLAPAVAAEVALRIQRHLDQARELEGLVLQARRPDEQSQLRD